jgi:hypothetical protein
MDTSVQTKAGEKLETQQVTRANLDKVDQESGQVVPESWSESTTYENVIPGPWGSNQAPMMGPFAGPGAGAVMTGTGPVFLPEEEEELGQVPIGGRPKPKDELSQILISDELEAKGTARNPITSGAVAGDLPPFPSLGKTGGIFSFEVRPEGHNGAVRILARWRAHELDRRGRVVKDEAGNPKTFRPAAYCGRWSAESRRGLPDDPEIARQVVLASAFAYLKAQGIEPKKRERRKGSNKRGQNKRGQSKVRSES